MKNMITLDIGSEDIALLFSPPDKTDEGFGLTLSLPKELEKAMNDTDMDVPHYMQVAFQLCFFLSNSDNLLTINKYWTDNHKSIEIGESE